MQQIDNPTLALRPRGLRPAITLTALAVFLATAVLALVSPATAEARRTVAPTTKASKSRSAKAANDAPRTVGKNGRVLVGVLNINTANEDQLQLLPGIGPTKAERVIAYRSKRGSFKRVKDLRRVKGFGYKTVKKISAHLSVKGPNTLKVESLDD